jgi:hypothetical protein
MDEECVIRLRYGAGGYGDRLRQAVRIREKAI